jgi:hypothetical protein
MTLLPFRKDMAASRKAPIERESGLQPSSALNEVNNQDDDGDYEQEVDQTAANVAK